MSDEGAERLRLAGARDGHEHWRRWGPYLADRAWATVREDYSANGDAWRYFPHDHARSQAYRWGEDGIAGFCDRYQILCWSLVVWNEADPILKERFFGLVPFEGNHGEDPKEYWFHLDALPSHAYQRMLYKYPQRPYPYSELIARNEGRTEPGEFELIDTGIFDDDRYFDIFIEIAKGSPDELFFRVEVFNRGPNRAPIHVIPQIWFRNIWAWGSDDPPRPQITRLPSKPGVTSLLADDSMAAPLAGLLTDTRLGPMQFDVVGDFPAMFTDNETNAPRIWGPGAQSRSQYTKDAFHRYMIDGETSAINPQQRGTKAAVGARFEVEPQAPAILRMRLGPPSTTPQSNSSIDGMFDLRRREADEFYESIHPPGASSEERSIQRQALAGMLWNKQLYLYDVAVWLDGDRPDMPPPRERQTGRNSRWHHLNSMRILSMPDTWEYPWFAAWDLAFQAVPLTLVDGQFAKEQLWYMLFEQFQHPNGQIPAYEWEFSDLNPPVHAWAVWRVFNMDRLRSGVADRLFLEKCFHKLMLNFTWWVNKVDGDGNNVFEGGFLGLDNIAVLDRSNPLPGGASLEQSDGTGWMGMFCLVMMRIALELARENPVYEGLATKFFEHYVYIGAAMKMKRGDRTLWDEEDGFFYDLLRFPDGSAIPFRVRSLVGLIPLYAIERLESRWVEPFPTFHENLEWFLRYRREIVDRCVTTVRNGDEYTHVLSVADREQVKRLIARVVDPAEFLSPHGMRSLSKVHEREPFVFGNASVRYEPAESQVKLKGGNSNWRGPVWFPTSFLMIETLRKLEKAFGQIEIVVTRDDTSKKTKTLSGIAKDLAERMISIFLPDTDGYRPVYGPRGTRKSERFARDPHWHDLLQFHEYFNGDNGEGLGANHQTGWTGLVASLIDEWRR